ncbi:MAG TPA: PEP-CTERM sorting domain-containing protein [Acetobacteraceae bacterium]|nr:PEP-CTERM sorting domain-containing protein [Acetobacteraceae bacterium]
MIAPAGPACADEVIWNSFGTGYASAVWSGDAIFGSAAEGPAYTANGFVPSTNYDITQIDLGLTYVHSTDANITLELVTDDGGVPSITAPEPVGGDVLESWTITDIPGPQVRQCTPVAHCTEPSAYPPVTVTSVPGVEVLAGDTYWLVAFPEDADTSVAWNDALAYTFGADAPIAFDFDNGGWSAVTGFEEQSAFDVLGTPVVLNAPEPSSLLLFVLGLLSLCVVHRLRSARA